MIRRKTLGALAAVMVLCMSGDLLACGEKFLMGGRGTRFQRAKSARAASVLIYAEPASPLAAALKKTKVESVLKLEGHRTTKVQSLDQLSTIIAAGHFDVILTANDVSPNVQRLVAADPKAATVLTVDTIGKDQSLLQVIDKAVAERDLKLKRAVRSS